VLNGLDICAGSGIGSAAFEAVGFCRTVCYVERDPYCQRLLQCRMQSGDLLPAPIWDDLRSFDGRPWRGCVDFVFGGIPCQPYSVAGKRGGDADERDLWPDFLRVLCEVRPRVALVENVAGFLAHGGGLARVVGELAEVGLDAEWEVLSAAGAGAPHRRERVWVVAYAGNAAWRTGAASGPGCARELGLHTGRAEGASGPAGDGAGLVADADREPEQQPEHEGEALRVGRDTRLVTGLGSNDLADADRERFEEQPRAITVRPFSGSEHGHWWAVEPDVGRVAHGVASRVDRLRTLGNGWVPHVSLYVAGRIQRGIGRRGRRDGGGPR